MNRHSNSLRTQSMLTQATSFFDTATYEEHIWRQIPIEEVDFSQYPVSIENDFHFRKKSFFKDWSLGTLTIKGSFLIFKEKKKGKNLKYVDFEENMYRIEIIGPDHSNYHPKYPYGFMLYANGNSAEFFCKDRTQFLNWISHFKKLCIMTDFHDNYKIFEILGAGGYGKVHRVESLKGESFAAKFIKLNSSISKDRQKVMILNEIRMLRKIDHPQIVKLYEVYEMPGQICLVMELVEGEKFFNFLTSHRLLSEERAAYVMKQIFILLCHLETQDIIHRDIKPENILCKVDEKGKINIKLIDFGLGTFHRKRDIIRKCGTAGYVAPEILNCEPYNFTADLYSAGVIMHICLTGRPVFYAKDYNELLNRNRKGVIRFKGSNWDLISPEAQDLIRRILEPLPRRRISLLDTISHEWLMSNLSVEDKKELSEYMFKISKLIIPEEDNISYIPRSSGQLPSVRKTCTNSLLDSALHKNVSHSFITSHLALSDNKELNSFYKKGSKDISTSFLTLSRTSISAFSNPDNGYVVTIPKGHTLAPPTLQIGSPRGLNHKVGSIKSANKLSFSGMPGGEYKIQVSAANDSWNDLELGHEEEEENLCSLKYENLMQSSIHNLKRIGERRKRGLMTEIKATKYYPQTTTFETYPDTSRTKHKVRSMSKGIRNYNTTGTISDW